MRLILILALLTLPSTSYCGSNYVMTTDKILPEYGASKPTKGESRTNSVTGATITARSNTAELKALYSDVKQGQVVYSRFSNMNSSGQYLMVHGTDSASVFIYRVSDNTIVADLKRDATHRIGENNEVRWDYTGNYPTRVYFVNGTGFYQMDVLTGNGSPTLLHDFVADFPTAVKVINDVEGDSSNDSRYWAWQVLGPYDGARYPRIAFITYDKTANAILGTLHPGDITPTANASTWAARLPEPNMVEISPDGSKVLVHGSRCYAGSATQDFCGTALDGAVVFDLNFNTSTYLRVSPSYAHSGWAYDSDGTPMLVSQKSTTDQFEACRITGGPYPANCVQFFDHASVGYAGVHFNKFYNSALRGWILASTVEPPSRSTPVTRNTAYANDYTKNYAYRTSDSGNGLIYRTTTPCTTGASVPTWPTSGSVVDGTCTWSYYGKNWMDNQLVMMEIKPIAESPKVWRVSPSYNVYAVSSGDAAGQAYRSEGSASTDLSGTKVHWTGNWGTWGTATDWQGEALEIALPTDWYTQLTGGVIPTPPPTTHRSLIGRLSGRIR